MLRVDARQYPVTTHFARATPDDHLLAAYRTVVKIHCRLPAGGVLVFLTGQREIEVLCAKIRERFRRRTRPAKRELA